MTDLDSWIADRTFHHSQFQNVGDLVARKEALGVTISLCFPALNEEKTIGREIRVLKREFMERHRLIDEIGVVDSGSTDRTRETSERAGATVFLASDYLPEFGPRRGKGENLWKSLYLFSGDIIVWVDSDIRNIHPKFVYGLLGPLLEYPEIGYVKAFYRRPVQSGRRMVPGGGRVTELLVRPFLNLLYPDLALLAQPLSGEYAGRRAILEQVPFFSGYGVEIGLLIDIEHRFGLRAMAQVDMDERVHRNQNIESLRRMSYVILSVLIKRSEQLGKLALLEGLGHQMNIVQRQGTHYLRATEEVHGVERPPMITVHSYQEQRGIQEDDTTLIGTFIQSNSTIVPAISDLLDTAIVRLTLSASERDAALGELVDLVPDDVLTGSRSRILAGLLEREERMTTGVGQGLAIPHLVSSEIRSLTLVIGASSTGVDFNSLDQIPVKLIFVILAPENMRSRYLQVLAGLARLLREEQIVQRALTSSTAEELIALMKKYEALIRLKRELEPGSPSPGT